MQHNDENEEQNLKQQSTSTIGTPNNGLRQINLPDLAIIDMQLIGNETILVADYNNRLLVFDASHPERTTREILLAEKPYGLTIVGEKLVAASVGHTKFQVVDMRSEKVLQTIEVKLISETSKPEINDSGYDLQNGYDEQTVRLWGIAYLNREFYFAAKNRVLKVNDYGTSCKTIFEIRDGWIFCIEIHNEKIYVTNSRPGSFMCLTVMGDIIFEIKPSNLKGPYGFTLDSEESFLVADLSGNMIHRIKSDGSRSTIVCCSNHGIVRPRTVLSIKHLGLYLIACDAGKKLYASQAMGELENDEVDTEKNDHTNFY